MLSWKIEWIFNFRKKRTGYSYSDRSYIHCFSIPRHLDPPETREPLVSLIPLDLFALLRATVHRVQDGALALVPELFFGHRLEQGELLEMGAHPVVEIADVRNGVHDAAGTEDVCVLGQEGRGDDACLVLASLEMGVREEEEEGGEGVLGEIVWHELHRVCADDRYVLVGTRDVS